MARTRRTIIVEGATNHAVALDHWARLALIAELRYFFIRRIQPKTWGGLFIADAIPREGRRVHRHSPWDENIGTGANHPDWGAA